MSNKKIYIITSILTLIGIIGLVVLGALAEKEPKFLWTVIVAIVVLIAMIVIMCFVYFKNIEFVCKKCNKQFKPSTVKGVFACHVFTKRLLKCPHCQKISWCNEKWNTKD